MNDLPPRTLRRWWLEWPKWGRIGCLALAGTVLLQIAVTIRMYVGLFESPGITELRQRRVAIRYFWETSGSPGRLPLSAKHRDYLYGGLFGKSWWNVTFISSSRLTPADLRIIRQRCPSLKQLALSGVEVSPELLEELAQCNKLMSLDLSRTDVDDTAIRSLTGLKSLVRLDLRETLVGNDVLTAFEEMPNLMSVDLLMTDVVNSELSDWKYRQQRLQFRAQGRTDESLAMETYGSIRWSDGSRSPGIPAGVNYRWDVLDESGRTDRTTSTSGITRSELILVTNAKKDGTKTRRLRIGGYDAEPVTILRENGKTSTPWVEFRMPCTREQALRQRQR